MPRNGALAHVRFPTSDRICVRGAATEVSIVRGQDPRRHSVKSRIRRRPNGDAMLNRFRLGTPSNRSAPASILALAFLLVFSIAGDAAAKKKRRKRKPRRTGAQVCATFKPGPAEAVMGAGFVVVPSKYTPTCTFSRRVPDADAREKAFTKAMMDGMAARMKAMQEKRKYEAPKPPHLDDTISVTHRGDADTAAAAKSMMESAQRTMNKGITASASGNLKKGFKSKVKIGDGPAKSTAETEAITEEVQRDARANVKKIERKAGRALPGADKTQSVSMTFQSKTESIRAAGLDDAYYLVKYRTLTARKGKRVITIEVKLDGKSDEERKELAIALAQEWLK